MTAGSDYWTRGWVSRNVNYAGVQARIKVDGQETTKSFAFTECGGVAEAEAAARAWLDEQSAQYPERMRLGLRHKNSPRKKNRDLPVGVSLCRDKDRQGRLTLSYQVAWEDGSKRRVKKFHLGRADQATKGDMELGLIAATSFRRAYEQGRLRGEPFDPLPWDGRDKWEPLASSLKAEQQLMALKETAR